MPVNIIISKLEDLSVLLSSSNVEDGLDDRALESTEVVVSELASVATMWDVKCTNKLAEIIKEYAGTLNEFYDRKFSLFDGADSLCAFDKKYDIRIPIRAEDYSSFITFLRLHLLLAKIGDAKYSNLAKKTISNTLGRFLVLFYGSFNVSQEDFQSFCQHPFYKILILSLACLSFYEWGVDETVLLRLSTLNLLDVLGPGSLDLMKDSWVRTCEKLKSLSLSVNEHSGEVIIQCFDKYYNYQATGKIIEPLDTTWLYAYIYKQRFGFLYCKKIARSSTNAFYPFTFRTTALCFKGLVDRVTGNSPKVVLFEKGVVRRSSEYRPLESNFLFNYTSMKFE